MGLLVGVFLFGGFFSRVFLWFCGGARTLGLKVAWPGASGWCLVFWVLGCVWFWGFGFCWAWLLRFGACVACVLRAWLGVLFVCFPGFGWCFVSLTEGVDKRGWVW